MGLGLKLSVVIPVFNEGERLEENIKRVIGVLSKIENEIILVNDGSSDNSWLVAAKLATAFQNVIAIDLSRNFGKEAAICAGLDEAKGDCTVVMDADMQHPPEYIPVMYEMWRKGAEVVEGVKKTRGPEKLSYKFCATLFYKINDIFTGITLKNASDFRLMDKKVVEAFKQMPERQTFFRAMSSWVGFKREKLYFEVAKRQGGSSRWSVKRLFRLSVNAITSFSAWPLHFVTMFGVLFIFASLIMIVQTVYMKLKGNALEGFTTVILLLLIIGGVLMMSLGIIGIYIAKIYEEIKARPRYIVRERQNKGE